MKSTNKKAPWKRFTARKRQKFNAKATGKFKSRLENTVWKQLPHKRKGFKFAYESEKLIYVTQRRYIPDIVVKKPNGEKFYIEIKGWFRSEDRTKMIAAKAFNPDLDIRIVFASDSPLRKGSNKRYSDWCKKHGFQYAIGEVPKEWFDQ